MFSVRGSKLKTFAGILAAIVLIAGAVILAVIAFSAIKEKQS